MWYASGMSKTEVPQRVINRVFERLGEHSPDECWPWPGGLASGYGRVGWRENYKGYWAAAHRIVWEALKGPIPEGLDLDHLCHDPETCTIASECQHRRCCNPDHLEPVTRKVNLARGGTIPARNSKITHCPKGHPYDGTNLFHDTKGRRNCRECVRARNREYYHKNRERRAEYNRQWRIKNARKKKSLGS